MKSLATAAACIALALLTFFQFPGHTWLQQDSQIYAPILEHLRDPAVLRNDILVLHPHVAFTLYDETALALRAITGAGFREVLAAQQIATRALGIWGLLLMAEALGLAFAPAFLVAALCSLGAAIAGPSVLTFEYEPTPRAFAVPLMICTIGLAAHRRHLGAGIAAAAAFLYHAPTALPFWGVYFVVALWPHQERRARLAALMPLAAAVALLSAAAHAQSASGYAQRVFARLDSAQEFLQRMRTSYVWISAWPTATILHHLLVLSVLVAAFVRIRRVVGVESRVLLLGLAALGLLTMPLSWLLLEQFHWGLVPQVQPMRTLLFLTLGMQFLTAAAGARALVARRPAEALAWFAFAYLLPLQPVLTGPFVWSRLNLALALAALTALAGIRWAPAVALAAFVAIPMLGGVVNYPSLHTPDLAQLSAWARANTPRDAVFVFPDVNRGLAPGIFRTEALRAVYVDWKGGGQVNYLKDLGEQWWFRWRQTRNFKPTALPQYAASGITYVVLQEPLPRAPQFQNATYVVYQLK
ncbi:MAG: hypothetical protein NTW28_11280 [Candidatus Solibacter sp.]|nr:hypothetical protein [Candidatus Solibacter sp.]